MAKYANITFSLSIFANGNLDIYLLRDILMALPSDTKIVGMGDSMSTYTCFMRVESNSFIDTTPAGILPEIQINFKKNGHSGGIYLDSLDYSAALGKPPLPAQKCNCGVCYHCVMQAPSPVPLSSSSPNYAVPSNSPPPSGSGYNRIFIAPDPSTFITNASCSHKWKIYDSGWRREEFCELCPEKRDV